MLFFHVLCQLFSLLTCFEIVGTDFICLVSLTIWQSMDVTLLLIFIYLLIALPILFCLFSVAYFEKLIFELLEGFVEQNSFFNFIDHPLQFCFVSVM